jgi:hypothetical protein
MVTSQKLDFSDWVGQNISSASCPPTGGSWSGDPATHVINVAPAAFEEAAVYTDSINSNIEDAAEFNLYGRLWFDDSDPNENWTHLEIYIIATNNNGVGFGFREDPAYTGFTYSSIADGARCSIQPEGSQNPTNAGIVPDKWLWFKIYKDKDDLFRYYYNFDGGTARPTQWTYIGDAYAQTVSFDTIVEFGCASYAAVAAGAMNLKVDDLELEIANEDKSALAGFTAAVSANIKSIYSMWGTNARGSAKIEVGDQENSIAATIQGDLGKLITLDNPYGLAIFKGEIKGYEAQSESIKTLTLDSIGQKLPLTICKTNPLTIDPFVIQHVDDKVLYNKDANWSSMANKAISFEKTDTKTLIVHPTTVSYYQSDDTSAWTPDTKRGAVTDLFYDDWADFTNTVPTNILGVHHDGTEVNEDRVQFLFEPWLISGATIDKLLLRIIWDPIRYITWADDCIIMIYNYTDAAWENMYNVSTDPDGVGYDYQDAWQTNEIYNKYVDHTIDLKAYATAQANALTEYIDEGAANNSGYKKHEIKIRFNLGDQVGDWPESAIWRYLELKIIVAADQTVVYGLGKIASNTATAITLTSAGAAVPNLTELPAEEGYGEWDLAYISDWVDVSGSGIAQDIFTNSSISLTLSFSATNSNKITEITNLYYETLFTMLQKWADILNGIWWVDYEGDQVVFQTPDNLVDSGVTLTQADTADNLWTHNIDIRNIANNIRVLGKGDIAPVVTTTTPEFTLGGDDEDAIYRDIGIATTIEAKTMQNSKKFVHEKARREIRMTLNYSKPNQDYSPLEVGKLVTVQLPSAGDTSECDYSSSSKVVITTMEFNRNKATGYQDFYTLTMQRRYS